MNVRKKEAEVQILTICFLRLFEVRNNVSTFSRVLATRPNLSSILLLATNRLYTSLYITKVFPSVTGDILCPLQIIEAVSCRRVCSVNPLVDVLSSFAF